MSIASRITAMQEHLRDDYDVLNLAGADLTNVDKNIVNLKPTWKERLLYFMNNGTDVVWENWDKVVGEGTSLTLNNTEEAPMSLVYKGNTYQEGTPTPESPQDIHVVSGDNTIDICGKNLAYMKDGTYTKDYNTAVVSNNLITLNTSGSTGSNSYFSFANGYTQTWAPTSAQIQSITDQKLTGDGGNYIATIYTNKVITGSVSIRFYTSNNREIMARIENDTITNISISLNDGEHIKDYGSWIGNTTIFNDYQIRVQLEKGDQATTYEPYIGNTYPIYLGVENLFPNGLTQRDTTSVYTSSIPVMPNTTYSIDTSLSNLRIFNIYQDADKNTINNSDWMNIPTTFTTINGCYYLQIVIGKSDSSAITTSEVEGNIDLTKGTTPQRITATPIELCKIGTYQDYIYKDNGSWYLHKEIGKVVLDGSENWTFRTDWTLTNASVFRNSGYVAGEFETGTEGFSNYLVVLSNIPSLSSYHHIRVTNSNGYGTQLFIDDTFLGITSEDTTAQKTAKLKTWLGNHNTTFYGIKPTPTNTLIEDTTLIEQLESLSIANSIQGQTNISQTNNDMPFELDVVALGVM